MLQPVASLLVGFVVLLVTFRLLERLQPADRRMKLRRRGFATDLAWFAFTPLVTKSVTRFGVAIALVPAALFIHGRLDAELIRQGYGPLAQLPLWLQALLILLLGDLIGYWMHRWFHGRRLWNYHAVHHSSTELDWLSAVRVHPVNDLLMKIAASVPLVVLGFAPIAVVAILPVLTVMAIMLHANLDWDYGPLRTIIASPRFHRWHHTDESEARDTNFAGLFPVWDILFGTYYMPRGRLPLSFGTDTRVPAGFVGQIAFPFRPGKAAPASSGNTRQSATGPGGPD